MYNIHANFCRICWSSSKISFSSMCFKRLIYFSCDLWYFSVFLGPENFKQVNLKFLIMRSLVSKLEIGFVEMEFLSYLMSHDVQCYDISAHITIITIHRSVNSLQSHSWIPIESIMPQRHFLSYSIRKILQLWHLVFSAKEQAMFSASKVE